MDLHQELAELIAALDAAGVEYALCGGLALAVHGHPRFTKDIDLLVPEAAVEAAAAEARKLGFFIDAGVMPFGTGGPHAREVRRLSKVIGKSVLPLDLIILPGFLGDVWATREEFEWAGQRLRVVSREGLVRMKRIADRTQDQADLERLLGDSDE